MYFLALLFFAGAAYNLFIGDIIEGIWGLAIAVVLGAGKYSWDLMKDEKFIQRIRMPILVIILVLVFSFISIKVVVNIEVGTEKYVELAEIKKSFPEIRKSIEQSMKDGKVSIAEFRKIQDQYQKIRKAKAIRSLKEN